MFNFDPLHQAVVWLCRATGALVYREDAAAARGLCSNFHMHQKISECYEAVTKINLQWMKLKEVISKYPNDRIETTSLKSVSVMPEEQECEKGLHSKRSIKSRNPKHIFIWSGVKIHDILNF